MASDNRNAEVKQWAETVWSKWGCVHPMHVNVLGDDKGGLFVLRGAALNPKSKRRKGKGYSERGLTKAGLDWYRSQRKFAFESNTESSK